MDSNYSGTSNTHMLTPAAVGSAMVSNHLDNLIKASDSNNKLVTLYCDHGSQASQTLDELERSIFHQILADVPKIPQQIHNLRHATREGFSPALTDLHAVFKSCSLQIGTVFVVLDALDEAADDVQNGILARISALPFPDIRLLCTSRPSPQFKQIFSTNYQIQIIASNGDVESFVRQQMQDNARLVDIVGEDTALKDVIIATVIKKADGM